MFAGSFKADIPRARAVHMIASIVESDAEKMVCAAGQADAQLLLLVDIVENSPTANSGGICVEDARPVTAHAAGLNSPPLAVVMGSSSCRSFAGCARRCIDRADKPINYLRVADGASRRGPLRILG